MINYSRFIDSYLIEDKSHSYNVLEDRLIVFAANIVDFCNRESKKNGRIHLLGQLIRSGTSPALNYAEAQNAESKKDFIHKMSICLKELEETHVCLKIISMSQTLNSVPTNLMDECNQLVRIFNRSITTAKKNP